MIKYLIFSRMLWKCVTNRLVGNFTLSGREREDGNKTATVRASSAQLPVNVCSCPYA